MVKLDSRDLLYLKIGVLSVFCSLFLAVVFNLALSVHSWATLDGKAFILSCLAMAALRTAWGVQDVQYFHGLRPLIRALDNSLSLVKKAVGYVAAAAKAVAVLLAVAIPLPSALADNLSLGIVIIAGFSAGTIMSKLMLGEVHLPARDRIEKVTSTELIIWGMFVILPNLFIAGVFYEPLETVGLEKPVVKAFMFSLMFCSQFFVKLLGHLQRGNGYDAVYRLVDQLLRGLGNVCVVMAGIRWLLPQDSIYTTLYDVTLTGVAAYASGGILIGSSFFDKIIRAFCRGNATYLVGAMKPVRLFVFVPLFLKKRPGNDCLGAFSILK